jgi:hypothetical protein
MMKCVFWLHASLILVCSLGAASAQAGQSSIVLTGAPTGTTNDTNPEIHVSAPNAVSYKYSLSGAPYSDELPISAPITLSAGVRFGDRSFAAGTGDLSNFINLRSTDDSFTQFLNSITLSDVRSQLQITYLLNRIRAAVGSENVFNIWGPGLDALTVTLTEKVDPGVRPELSALTVTGGKLSSQVSPDSTRRFLLRLATNSDAVRLMATANNTQTTITVNGQPVGNGSPIVLSHPIEGSSITLQTTGPDGSRANYAVEIAYDDSLDATDYRGYYLRAFTPSSSYVSVHNGGAVVVAYGMTFNNQLGLTKQGILREIETMEPEFADESMAHKVWRFIRGNRYHFDPLTGANWFSSVALFFNSAGFGYCDDSAGLFQELMTGLGYTARTWGLNGHVVSEVLVNGRWEMWERPDRGGTGARVRPDPVDESGESHSACRVVAVSAGSCRHLRQHERQRGLRAGAVRGFSSHRGDPASRDVRVPRPLRRSGEYTDLDAGAVLHERAPDRTSRIHWHGRHQPDRPVHRLDQ